MSSYSRIFHHITVEDVKRNERERNALEKIEEFKEEEIIEPVKHVDWRSELKESDWTNTTTGNKVASTFTHSGSGDTFTHSAIGGVIPSTTEVSGETVAAPTESQYDVLGYAPLMQWDMQRKDSVRGAEEINQQLDSSEEYTKKIKADVLMKARLEKYYNKEDAIRRHNDKVRIENWKKVTDYVDSLGLGITARDLQQKGAIKIPGGAVGMEDDGEGNIKIGVFKGPDVYTKGPFVYYKGEDYTSEIKDFNTEEGVKPTVEMPSDLQKWEASQNNYGMYGDDMEPAPEGEDTTQDISGVLDKVAQKMNVGTAKDVFDYHMNFIKNPTDKPQDVTNLIRSQDMNKLKSWTGRYDFNRPLDRDAANAELLSVAQSTPGLKNTLGNLDLDRGDGITKITPEYIEIRKAYDFDGITDIGGAGPLTGVAAAVYGASRMGVQGIFQGTPTMNMIIKIPRKKKKVNEGTTFSGIKRVVKERTKKVVA